MTSILDPKLWLAALLTVGLSYGMGRWHGDWAGQAKIQTKWDTQAKQQAQQLKDADAENRRIELARQRNVTDAQNKAVERALVLRTDADSARTESDRLRDNLAATRLQLPSLTRDAVNQYADAASVVFDECQRSYQGLARKADGHANDTLMFMQSWPK